MGISTTNEAFSDFYPCQYPQQNVNFNTSQQTTQSSQSSSSKNNEIGWQVDPTSWTGNQQESLSSVGESEMTGKKVTGTKCKAN